VKIRTSGYQTLECFNASLDPNLGLNPSLTVLSQICRYWPVNCTEVRLADGLHPALWRMERGWMVRGGSWRGNREGKGEKRLHFDTCPGPPEFLDTPMNATRPRRYGNSHAMRDHTVLPAIRQMWHSRPHPTKAGSRFSDPGGMQGWVDTWALQ